MSKKDSITFLCIIISIAVFCSFAVSAFNNVAEVERWDNVPDSLHAEFFADHGVPQKVRRYKFRYIVNAFTQDPQEYLHAHPDDALYLSNVGNGERMGYIYTDNPHPDPAFFKEKSKKGQ